MSEQDITASIDQDGKRDHPHQRRQKDEGN